MSSDREGPGQVHRAAPGAGEYVWVVGSPDTGEMGTKVSIGTKLGEPSDERGWADARFYQARIFSPDYE